MMDDCQTSLKECCYALKKEQYHTHPEYTESSLSLDTIGLIKIPLIKLPIYFLYSIRSSWKKTSKMLHNHFSLDLKNSVIKFPFSNKPKTFSVGPNKTESDLQLAVMYLFKLMRSIDWKNTRYSVIKSVLIIY